VPPKAPDPDAVRAAAAIAVALGGPANITAAGVCAITRVRVKVVNPGLVNDTALRQGGVAGVMRLGGNVLHLIVGARAEVVASALTADLHLATTPR
jgi:phosphotransferase system IIB component